MHHLLLLKQIVRGLSHFVAVAVAVAVEIFNRIGRDGSEEKDERPFHPPVAD